MSQASARGGAPQDEFILDTPALRGFIADIRRTLAAHLPDDQAETTPADVAAALDALQPRFAALLADQDWLSDPFAQPDTASGMGGGIASWLLFRAADRSLSLISLVVPPGAVTPIHDHLAWGLVGLYRGEQEEIVYQREAQPAAPGANQTEAQSERAVLTVAQVNHLKPGDFYQLIPPDGDIHSVKTTSPTPSISIHLLANDIGCMVRHTFDVEQSTVRAFRSGYSNVACDANEETPAA